MMKSRNGVFLALLALAIGTAAATPARAQGYPSKPVKLIVPFPPSGPMDILGRLVAHSLSKAWGVSVITVNRPGAGGTIGGRRCKEARPDGYTMCVMPIAQTIAPSLYKNPGFDPVKDFAHIGMVATLPSVLNVDPSLPVKNVRELIALAKSKPGVLNYASGGKGTSTYMLMALLKHEAGIDMVDIPYKGQGPALVAQLSGRVSVAFDTILAALPYIKEGKLRPIGISTAQRFALLPNVPTIDESGLKGFNAGSWGGLVMPAGVPRAIVTKVNRDLEKILASPAMKQRILKMGGLAVRDTPEEFTAFVKSQVRSWAKVAKAAGIYRH